MAKVYIGFSNHNKSWLSWLIRKVQGAEYSHVYIRRESKYGEYIYQASGLAVNFMNISTFRAHNTIAEEYEFDLSELKREQMLEFFIKYVGRPYDWMALFKILSIMASKRLGVSLNIKGTGEAEFICSELGYVFCEQILGIDIPENEDFISPKELNPYIAKHGVRTV